MAGSSMPKRRRDGACCSPSPGPEHTAARCALARCLIAQRRLLEARAALIAAEGDEADDLRAQILAGPGRDRGPSRRWWRPFLEILRVCQEVDDGELTLGARVGADPRAAGRVDGGVRRAGTASIRCRSRTPARPRRGSDQLEIASRVLDTGLAVGPADRGPAVEAAWPIRYGATVVGALWCHWAIGAPVDGAGHRR